jgi:hypothetical protein
METLYEAKKHLRENWEKGVECPCCTQFVKLYKRKLNSQMARFLINLYVLDRDRKTAYANWFSTRQIAGGTHKASSDGSYLIKWGLVRRKDAHYQITHLGILFVEGRATAYKYALIFNNDLYRLEGEEISILDALGSKFDYQELMTQ